MAERITVGTAEELRSSGFLTGKAGAQPICVFWSEGEAYALDDRCPHMGFPLHRGTVESGLVTCHWHNARFDLGSGGTLDPFADDVRSYPVELDDGLVTVVVEPEPDRTAAILPAAAWRRAWSRASPSSSPRRCSVSSTPVCRPARSCGSASSSAPVIARRAGGRG